MVDEKDYVIIEFITKTQGLAYNNKFGVCCLCGGGREYDKHNSKLWKPKHSPDCLYSQAEKLVIVNV